MNRGLLVSILLLSGTAGYAADSELLRLVMPDAKIVSGVDFGRLKASPLGQFMLSQIGATEEHLGKLAEATGFDPRRDVHEILMASSGEAPNGQSGLILVKGTFDAARISGLIKTMAQAVENYRGIDIFSQPQGGHGPAGGFAFLDGTTAIIGDPANVKAAIDRRSQPASLDPAMAARISGISGTYDAWGVSLMPIASFKGAVPNRNVDGMLQGDLFKTIQSVSGGVKFGASIEMAGEAATRSDQDAASLVDVAKFLIGMIQTNGPRGNAPEAFLTAIGGMQVAAQASTVKFSLSIPSADLEQFLRSRGSSAKRAAIR